MAERRTLGDALSITPDKLAFIHGDESSQSERSQKATSKTVDVSLSAEAGEVRSGRQKRRTKEREFVVPNANELLGEVLVPLTTRIPHRLIQSIRRLCLERQLSHAKPDSIQKIIEAALEDWLAKWSA